MEGWVSTDLDKCGRLWVTSDGIRGAGSKIVKIASEGENGSEGVFYGSTYQ
eukprot:CAMPEP_0194415362 /NCGR_PEP_ID=MMETSP0176-20130528/14121_1 /TAXON_ID=216777 /ORGANISM="Proboscia alata, Strain PI-D3" /LENGTH=50 /DNA_ID=CAMNT_0039219941 /DNA_START=237 /DNA_END=389 /DNA_ORIENTATION=+